jgi:16S rRNA (cytidine1402-2'-O)-methyltransferase
VKGKLFVVATPIGNLSDITQRAVDTLKSAAFVLAEDTRQTRKLFDRYSIDTQLVSYRDQNHDRMIDKVLEKLDAGLDLALVSDAGTPLISDPGYRLVSILKQKEYEVVPIPGPDSVTATLSASGLPTDRYIFLGFLPKSDLKRKELLTKYLFLDATIAVFESPNRVQSLLTVIKEVAGGRKVTVANDITKLHERIYTGSIEGAAATFEGRWKGEFVVLISKESI